MSHRQHQHQRQLQHQNQQQMPHEWKRSSGRRQRSSGGHSGGAPPNGGVVHGYLGGHRRGHGGGLGGGGPAGCSPDRGEPGSGGGVGVGVAHAGCSPDRLDRGGGGRGSGGGGRSPDRGAADLGSGGVGLGSSGPGGSGGIGSLIGGHSSLGSLPVGGLGGGLGPGPGSGPESSGPSGGRVGLERSGLSRGEMALRSGGSLPGRGPPPRPRSPRGGHQGSHQGSLGGVGAQPQSLSLQPLQPPQPQLVQQMRDHLRSMRPASLKRGGTDEIDLHSDEPRDGEGRGSFSGGGSGAGGPSPASAAAAAATGGAGGRHAAAAAHHQHHHTAPQAAPHHRHHHAAPHAAPHAPGRGGHRSRTHPGGGAASLGSRSEGGVKRPGGGGMAGGGRRRGSDLLGDGDSDSADGGDEEERWRYLLPDSWSCPEGNAAGILVDEEEDRLLCPPSSRDQQPARQSSRSLFGSSRSGMSLSQVQPVQRVALVVANKPVPMEELERRSPPRPAPRQTSLPLTSSRDLAAASSSSSAQAQAQAQVGGPPPTARDGRAPATVHSLSGLVSVPSFAPPPAAPPGAGDAPDGGGGLYPIFQRPPTTRPGRSDPDGADNDLADMGWAAHLLRPGEIRRSMTHPLGDALGGGGDAGAGADADADVAAPPPPAPAYYFEARVLSGSASVGLVPAETFESVVTTERARLLGRSAGAGAAARPHPFPVLLDQSPGRSPFSVGLGCTGRLSVSGATVSRAGEALRGAEAKGAEPWMDPVVRPGGGGGEVVLGCGWEIGGSGRVFFTRDGEIINPGTEVPGFDATGRTMFPAVSVPTEGGDVVGNFGLDPGRPFAWRDYTAFVPVTAAREANGAGGGATRPRGGGGRDAAAAAAGGHPGGVGGAKSDGADAARPTTAPDAPKVTRSAGPRASEGDPAAGVDVSSPMCPRPPAAPGAQQSQEELDLAKAYANSKDHLEDVRSPPSDPVRAEEFEEAREIARELRSMAHNPSSDPRVFSFHFEQCKSTHQRVKHTLEKEETAGDDFFALLELNELLLDAVTEAEESMKKRKRHLIRIMEPTPQPHPEGSAAGQGGTTALKESHRRRVSTMPLRTSEIDALAEKRDVFSLICLLRGHHDKRLAAAYALMRFAKDKNAKELRDEIRSSGGLHSLLTLFKSSSVNPELKVDHELKVVTALAVAYLLPSCDPAALLKLGLKVIDCLHYLIDSKRTTSPCAEIELRDMRETAALALTHLWLYALQPKLTLPASGKDLAAKHRRGGTRSFLSDLQLAGGRGLAGSGTRRLEQRHDTLEFQELLETTVSLVVAVANSEILDQQAARSPTPPSEGESQGRSEESIEVDLRGPVAVGGAGGGGGDDDDDGQGKEEEEEENEEAEAKHELRYNVALTVATICAVESARPVAVREGVLKVLVRWLSSGDVDLVLPAANALRDLTSPDDEYMAGWIHSQIVNEGALPAIVKLSEADRGDIRLAAAQILSGLSVAPHTRAAIVDAKGLNYLVQLLVNSSEADSGWDEPLALAAGSALLQLAAGAMMHATGWARTDAGEGVSTDRRDGVINDIVQGGAIEPLVAMAKFADRGKLRLMAIETLRVISEDVRPGRWTRQKLCDAGAAEAFGRVLGQDVPDLHEMIEHRKIQLDTKEYQPAPGGNTVSSKEAMNELHHALHALANILEPMSPEEGDRLSLAIRYGSSTPSKSQDTLVSVCIQTAQSGGIESLLLMASLPVVSSRPTQLDIITSVDLNELLAQSCRSLASLCPLLISDSAAKMGYAAWAGDALLALMGVLKQKIDIDDTDEVEMVRQLQLDALRGMCALAEYEPLKLRIIDDSLPQILQFKSIRGDPAHVAQLAKAANQVCSALGFSEDEIDAQLVGNDPKLIADWFCLERSMILQAMARDEIRAFLCSIWCSALLQVFEEEDHVHPSDLIGGLANMATITEESNRNLDASQKSDMGIEAQTTDGVGLLRRFFKNLGDDRDSAGLRSKLLQQYANVYEKVNNSRDRCRSVDTLVLSGRSRILNSMQAEAPNKVPRSSSDGIVRSRMAPGMDGSDAGIGLLGISPCTIIGGMPERDWIMKHQHAKTSAQQNGGANDVTLPTRIQALLDVCFPSKLLQSEVLPLSDICPDSSFNFRALAMPQRRYFSFRREGQVLSRVCEKHAAAIDSEDVHWTLGFTNSSFAGEFAETLVQALYRCPIIQAMSFSKASGHSRTGFWDGSEDDGEDDGATLLSNLAGSLPPWVTYLTFDNIMNRRSLHALVKILQTMGGHVGKSHQGTFHGLAIRNSPHLGSESFGPFFDLLGSQPGQPTPALRQSPLLSLKLLDLSGNKLGDESVASVLSVVHQENSKCSLERLDVSGNKIGVGTKVERVLRTYIVECRQAQLSGLPIAGDGWCSSLTWLNLASNNLGSGVLALEIAAMLKNDALALKSLDLSNNGIRSDDDEFLLVLSRSLIANTKLIELNLSKNRLSNTFVRALLKETHSRLAFLHLDGNDAALVEKYQDDLKRSLTAGRIERLKQVLKDNGQLEYKRSASSEEGKPDESELALRCDEDIEQESEEPRPSGDSSLYSEELSTFPDLGIAPRRQTQRNYSVNDIDGLSNTTLKLKRRASQANMLTVLFSAPLVWKDNNDQFQPIEMLDFELERELLWQCFKEAQMDIELSFDNATTDRLQATMTKNCGCLHFSGHGHPEYLTFEDGRGGLHWLGVTQLKGLISNGVEGGGAPFKFVFVSACHSGLAGETFVNAGVPHVVCCHQESQLMDSAALAFTRAFYLALAIGRTVKDSFEIGRQAVAVSPSVSKPQEEMEKFILLPKNGNHDEPVFNADRVTEWPRNRQNACLQAGISRRDFLRKSKTNFMGSSRDFETPGNVAADIQSLPNPPQGFLGREIEMYLVLNAILSKRLVSLVGMAGIGRSSLASALCQYINERKSTMTKIESILCIRARQARGNDRMGSIIYPLQKRLVAAGKAASLLKSADIDDVCHSIFKALNQMKTLIVFDRVEMIEGSEEAQEFPLFLSTLFRETKYVRVLMTGHKRLGIPSLGGVGEHVFELQPLNLKNTVRLFGMLCPFIHTGDERRRLIEELVDPNELHLYATDKEISDRSKAILNILGEGIPSRTFDVAYKMTKEEYDDLMKLGYGEE